MVTRRILVTGGAGFIGSAFVRFILNNTACSVLVVDKLTYAGNLGSLQSVANDARFRFLHADICDAAIMNAAVRDFRPDVLIHFAAETHVDRSIDGPATFIKTNIEGTFNLLQVALHHWSGLCGDERERFRFHHVSTDEVFGALGPTGRFTEASPYRPNSPYAASKAASDHLVRSWYQTYSLPVVLSNCSNNFGPFQFPEKFVPKVIINALEGKPIPVYGSGDNVRDWLYVDDHAAALLAIVEQGQLGRSYNVGAECELTNLQLVREICLTLDRLAPRSDRSSYYEFVEFVTDRPGHDFRYALDTARIGQEIGWSPVETFATGLSKTVNWYLDNRTWWKSLGSEGYAGERLGFGRAARC